MSCWDVISSQAYKDLPDDQKMELLVSVQKACDRSIKKYRFDVEADRELRWIGYGVLLTLGAFLLGGLIAWFWHGVLAIAIYCLIAFLFGVGIGLWLGVPLGRELR